MIRCIQGAAILNGIGLVPLGAVILPFLALISFRMIVSLYHQINGEA